MNFTDFNLFEKSALAAAALSVGAMMTSCSKENITQPPVHQNEVNVNENQATTISNQYLVVLKTQDNSPRGIDNAGLTSGVMMDQSNNLLKANNIANVGIEKEQVFHGGFIANLNNDQVAALKNDPKVESVEQDQLIAFSYKAPLKAMGVGSTVVLGKSTQLTPWGVKKIGGAKDATGKTAWIIDSGIDFNHTDLNIDKVRSKSFLSSTSGGNYSSASDEFGHGTMVAGIIAAKDNSFGSVGVAANATVVSLKVMNYQGHGTLGQLVRALNYVAANGKAGDVVNISLGASPSVTLDNAVKAVAAKGIYVSIASGNSAVNCSNMSPQRVSTKNSYTVSAIDSSGAWASYSNYGNPVRYATPGSYIYTTLKGGGYGYATGTSFAAPYMAGILLVNGGNPNYAGFAKNDPDASAKPIAHR